MLKTPQKISESIDEYKKTKMKSIGGLFAIKSEIDKDQFKNNKKVHFNRGFETSEQRNVKHAEQQVLMRFN